MTTLFADRITVSARARLLGERLDLRTLENADRLSDLPLTLRGQSSDNHIYENADT